MRPKDKKDCKHQQLKHNLGNHVRITIGFILIVHFRGTKQLSKHVVFIENHKFLHGKKRYRFKASEVKWKSRSPEFEVLAQSHNEFYLQKSICLIALSAEKS